jgi:hypothetical protein
MHFAIHEDSTFWLRTQPGHDESTIVSFTVEELEPVLARLEQRGREGAAPLPEPYAGGIPSSAFAGFRRPSVIDSKTCAGKPLGSCCSTDAITVGVRASTSVTMVSMSAPKPHCRAVALK